MYNYLSKTPYPCKDCGKETVWSGRDDARGEYLYRCNDVFCGGGEWSISAREYALENAVKKVLKNTPELPPAPKKGRPK